MSDWKVGDRVRIPSVELPMRQPHGGHEGKQGFITGTEPVEFADTKFDVPVITLDDGTVLKGYECWWEPVKITEGEIN
jgi:hypothetical protein